MDGLEDLGHALRELMFENLELRPHFLRFLEYINKSTGNPFLDERTAGVALCRVAAFSYMFKEAMAE